MCICRSRTRLKANRPANKKKLIPATPANLVEVQCDPRQSQRREPIEHHVRQQLAKFDDRFLISFFEHPAERGHIRQSLQPQQPLDHGIVAIMIAITQFAKAQQ